MSGWFFGGGGTQTLPAAPPGALFYGPGGVPLATAKPKIPKQPTTTYVLNQWGQPVPVAAPKPKKPKQPQFGLPPGYTYNAFGVPVPAPPKPKRPKQPQVAYAPGYTYNAFGVPVPIPQTTTRRSTQQPGYGYVQGGYGTGYAPVQYYGGGAAPPPTRRQSAYVRPVGVIDRPTELSTPGDLLSAIEENPNGAVLLYKPSCRYCTEWEPHYDAGFAAFNTDRASSGRESIPFYKLNLANPALQQEFQDLFPDTLRSFPTMLFWNAAQQDEYWSDRPRRSPDALARYLVGFFGRY